MQMQGRYFNTYFSNNKFIITNSKHLFALSYNLLLFDKFFQFGYPV